MDDSLQILIVDDSEDDAHLVIAALRREGYIPNFDRVDSRETLQVALQSTEWDVIIADHRMPNLDSADVLAMVKESGFDIPVIIVSGHIEEGTAIAAMKAGAHDYIMKDNMARLIPAIERELDEVQRHRVLKRVENTVHHMAHNDALTGLANRKRFEHSLQNVLDAKTQSGQIHAVLYLDLDQFKIINDTCGHVAGDTLLRQLAMTLQTQVRESDVLARLGGDEFGVLLENCLPDDALQVAENLLEAVHEFRFVWQGQRYPVSCSIGISQISQATKNIDEVLSAVDVACYLAKEQGRNRIRVYAKNDNEMTKRYGEMQWVAKIAQALEEDRFVLYKQAIVSVADPTSVVQRWEFLLRLTETDGSILTPETFIPAAERYDLMPDIDRWVIRKACSYISNQILEGYVKSESNVFFINISGASLSEVNFYDFIRTCLDEYQVPGNMLCFEVTETAAINKLNDAAEFVAKIREIGCRFALDDFGSGLSSFSYLTTIPIDFVKIDGSFVSQMENQPVNCAIVEAINNIGHIAGLQTIAETVEAKGSLDKLQDIGVDFMQGYYLDEPQPAIESHTVLHSA